MWAELEDRRDLLRLLAVVAQGLGAKSLGGYEPASAELEEALAAGPEDREEQVTRGHG